MSALGRKPNPLCFLYSGLCVFKLEWNLAYELNYFEMNRHPFPAKDMETMLNFHAITYYF